MQALRYLIVLVLGLLAGWFLKGLSVEEEKARSPRLASVPAAQDSDVPGTAWVPPPTDHAARGADAAPSKTDAPAEQVEAAEEETPAGDGADPLVEMVKAQSAQWKAWAAMQAKQKAEGLFAGLGLDEATQKSIEEALVAEAERQAELAIAMLLGEKDLDPDAFASLMGTPPDLSPELEAKLATFLSDDEIAAVRGRVQEAHKKQLNDFADMQIGMMGIGDLSADQKTRMREVYAGKNVMQEQFTRFAELTRDRDRLKKVLSGEADVAKFMEKNFEPTRNRMRDILTPTQFEKYQAYEKTMIRQAEMGVKMMASMLQQKPGTKTPAGK